MVLRTIAALTFGLWLVVPALQAGAVEPAAPAISGAAVIAQTNTKAACKQSCEANRLACMKAGARANAQGIPVTSPDYTKKCWDGFNACDKNC